MKPSSGNFVLPYEAADCSHWREAERYRETKRWIRERMSELEEHPAAPSIVVWERRRAFLFIADASRSECGQRQFHFLQGGAPCELGYISTASSSLR